MESNRFPNTYKDVAEQKYQFSCVNPKDNSSWRYYNPTKEGTSMSERKAYANSVSAAIKVINNDCNNTNGALLYYSPKSMNPKGSAPNWNFKALKETTPVNIPTNSFRFFKYK